MRFLSFKLTERILVRFSCLFFLALFSCKQNSLFQGKGLTSLQGTWQEDTLSLEIKPPRQVFTRYFFKFSCDSVYMTLKTHASQNYFQDSCYSYGNWTEYCKGTYIERNDSLIITGVFTKSNFKMKVSGCHRTGNFRFWFTIHGQPLNGLMTLRNTEEHGLIFLKKIVTCACVPQRI